MTAPLPDGWRDVTIEDIASSDKGSIITGPFGSSISSKLFVESGVPVIRGGNLGFGGTYFNDAGLAFVTEEKSEDFKRYFAVKDDLIFTAAGTLGQIGLITDKAKFKKYIISNKQMRVRLDKRIVDPKYAFYWFATPEMRKTIENQNSGASVPLINLSKLRALPVRLPPLSTQRKIAAVLSTYDDLIENNSRRVRVLEDTARALYREWFMEYRFPGHEQAQFVEDEQGRRPAGWEHKQLGDLAFELRRSVDPTEVDPETRYVGLEHIPRRRLALDDWGTAASVQSTKLRFDEGDILFGKIRPYFHKVSVAPMGGVCSTDAIVIKSMKPQWGPLVTMTVFSDEFVDHSVQTSNGTKMPRASWPVLTKYPVTVPPAALLEQFNAVIEGVIQQGASLTLRNANLRRTRDLLLPRLVSGELDVSGLDISGVDDAAMGQEEMA